MNTQTERQHTFPHGGSLAQGCGHCAAEFTTVVRYGLDCRETPYTQGERFALAQLVIAECDAQPWRIVEQREVRAALVALELDDEVDRAIRASLPATCAFCDDAPEQVIDGATWVCNPCADRRGWEGTPLNGYVERLFEEVEVAA